MFQALFERHLRFTRATFGVYMYIRKDLRLTYIYVGQADSIEVEY